VATTNCGRLDIMKKHLEHSALTPGNSEQRKAY